MKIQKKGGRPLAAFPDAERELEIGDAVARFLSALKAEVLVTSDLEHFFEIDVGFRFHLLTFWAAIADVRFWSPAFMPSVRTFLRTCQPKRLLQRFRAKIAV